VLSDCAFRVFRKPGIFNVLTQMVALCSKLYHRKDKDFIRLTLLTENGGMNGTAEMKNEDR
jgi:hypothetical protein